MSTSKSESVEAIKITHLVAVVFPLLTITGFIFEHTYYKNFGINIADYIQWSEVLLWVFPHAMYGMMGVVIGFALASLWPINDMNSESNGEQYTIYLMLKHNKNWLLLVLIILIFIILILVFPNVPWGIIYICQLGLIMFLVLLNIKKITESILRITPRSALPHFIAVFLFYLMLVGANIYKKNRIAGNKGIAEVSFIYLDNSIPVSTNDSMVYIGQTEKYLFLYDKLTKQARVYSRNDLTHIKIK
ncbi:hypothetical protein ABN763_16115 [Spongiivirga sp. MCCC 1A20706]|uniref:hypothetical protein n=1 Tax=Spongiivirga sp. MCCC 1A20706 TaxID=3160963 RepID=UPI003977DA86